MPEITPRRWLTTCGWDDVPHLSEQRKADMLASIPPYLRDARAKGDPSQSAGSIYPVPESEFVIEPIRLQPWWPRAFGLDVGWNMTAAIWGALDKNTDVMYLYTEHFRKEAEPSIHAAAIKARGAWIPGMADPASRGRSQRDGEALFQNYIDLGVKIIPANTALHGEDGGIWKCWELLSTGRLKIFSTLQNLRVEIRNYKRDEKGRIIKKDDHGVDAMRYLVMGKNMMATQPLDLAAQTAAVIGDTQAGY